MQGLDQALGEIKTLGDLSRLAIPDERGVLELRLGYVITLFFLEGQTQSKRAAFVQVLRQYQSLFGSEITHYQKIGASRLTPAKSPDYLHHYKSSADNLGEREAQGDSDSFTPHLYGFLDGKDRDEPPSYYLGGSCYPIDPFLLPVSWLDSYIPASWVETVGYPKLVEVLRHWCELLQPIHGTAGLGTFFDQGSRRTNSGPVAFPFVKRFAGLDYNDTTLWQSRSADHDVRLIRTTNWLTVIDDVIVQRLGGPEVLATQLGSDCPIHLYGGGVIVQAGPKPELGDLNYGSAPIHYRTVGRTLKPMRFADYRWGLLTVPEPFDSLDETHAWLARFD